MIGSRMRRAVLAAMSVVVAVVVSAATPTPASAAMASVGNGLTTTDLNAVGMSAATLAQALVGSGVTVTNATFTGNRAQAGLIHLVDPAVVSFNDGVILSSGNIADIVGPNKSDGTTGDMAGAADPDLTALIQNSQTVYPMTFDAAVLEFDFVPATSPVYFTYTFGSDEYLEWVNLFNDVFAFYVNGTNCATVPGGPVSIDTVNDTVNPALFRDNSFSNPPANPINIESDGLSVELICQAMVVPGATNHLKLAIADTSDQILDSVVVLKSHSLSTQPPESCNDAVDNDDDLLVDLDDDQCSSTVTPPPTGSSGVGSSGNAPAFTGNEGQPGVVLDASALGWVPKPETVRTQWTVTGINGTPGTCEVSPAGTQPIGPGGVIAVATAVCPDDGEYVARVEGWDAENGSAFDYDVDFFVHNAPPAVAVDSPASGTGVGVGEVVTVSATVVDPGAGDAVTCSVDWGDGTTTAGVLANGTCTATHAYSAPIVAVVAVTATDGAGDSSAGAIVVEVTGAAPPCAVASTTATAGASQVSLSWTAACDGGAAVTSYDVRHATSSAMTGATTVPGASTGSPAATTATVSGLTPGTTYWFQVRATNSAGSGAWGPSTPVSATPYGLPGAPGTPTAVRDDFGAVKVTTSAPVSNGGAAITSYTFTSSPGGLTCTTASPTTGCIVTGLTGGTAYTFTARATNAAGAGPASVASPAVKPISRTVFSAQASTGATNTLVLVPDTTAAVPVGARLVVSLATDSTSSSAPKVSGVTFPSGGAATCTTSYTVVAGGTSTAGAGIMGGVVLCAVTTAIPANAPMRITLSSAPAKAVAMGEYLVGFTNGGTVTTKTLTKGVATAPSSGVTATVPAGALVIGMIAVENGAPALAGDTDTAGGSAWRAAATMASGTAGVAGVGVMRQYKFAATAATQTYNSATTTGTGTDWVGAVLTIQ